MKKQVILIGAGIILIIALFFGGSTIAPSKPIIPLKSSAIQAFDIQQYILDSKQQLSPSQAIYLSQLENNITRGDLPKQKIEAQTAIANFWKDSVQLFEPYAFYISMAAKLDNSEKNLTFAAQLILNNLRSEHDEAKLNWQTTEAIDLFEKAIALNPDNDDARIGLGSCYIFGKGKTGDPQQTMKGILELLSVVRKDSMNMKAQMMLGVGGYVSGQYDKAIARLTKVVTQEPDNLEAMAFLADTYAASGNKIEAIKWYQISKRLANNAAYSKEVEERIKSLEKEQ